MNRDVLRDAQEASSRDAREQWVRLLNNDVIGVDRDIETLVGLLQKRHRCGHDKATAVLVRRLSMFGDRRHDPS